MPKPLDIDRIKQFEIPRPIGPNVDTSQGERAGGPVDRWPSREPIRDGQVSIKAPLSVIERFKHICKEDRRTYADMLGILMDRYEGK